MRFAFKTSQQNTTWNDMLAVWKEADGIEIFESGWVFDHFYPIFSDSTGPCLDGWVTLAALAQATTRLRPGNLVTGIHYRHPAVLANMVSTIDIISGGRLELGELNGELARHWRARPEPVALPTALGYLPYAAGANFAIRRDAFQAAGGCDERFTSCGDDLDLSWRIQRGRGSLLFAPDAIMHYRLRPDLGGVMRQRYRYGQAEALLRRKFSDAIPPVAPRARARSLARMLARSPELFAGAARRGAWLAEASHIAGQLRGSARYRMLA